MPTVALCSTLVVGQLTFSSIIMLTPAIAPHSLMSLPNLLAACPQSHKHNGGCANRRG